MCGLPSFSTLARLFQHDPAEPRRLLGEALELARARGDRRWMRIAGVFRALQAVTEGNLADAAKESKEAVADARRAGHPFALVLGLVVDAWVRFLQGELESAMASAAESVQFAKETNEGDAFCAIALCIVGWVQQSQGDHPASLDTFVDAVATARDAAPSRLACVSLSALADAAAEVGDLPRATACADEAATIARASGYTWVLGRVARVRARMALHGADFEGAESALHEAWPLHESSGDVVAWCDSLDDLAAICAERGRALTALRLWSAASAQRVRFGYQRTGPSAKSTAAAIRNARRALGEAAESSWHDGAGLSLREASIVAVGERGKRGRPRIGWQSLTPAELEVVRLVARHLSNPEIAERLVVSRATVKTHLVHVFNKLGVTSRSELAAEALRRGVDTPPTDI
jgi:DNA-binding CsgD family transcriptional regulator